MTQNNDEVLMHTFIDSFLHLLSTYPPLPGKYILVYKTDISGFSNAQDISSLVTAELIQSLKRLNYDYPSGLSTSDYIVLLDINEGYEKVMDANPNVVYIYDSYSKTYTQKENIVAVSHLLI